MYNDSVMPLHNSILNWLNLDGDFLNEKLRPIFVKIYVIKWFIKSFSFTHGKSIICEGSTNFIFPVHFLFTANGMLHKVHSLSIKVIIKLSIFGWKKIYLNIVLIFFNEVSLQIQVMIFFNEVSQHFKIMIFFNEVSLQLKVMIFFNEVSL